MPKIKTSTGYIKYKTIPIYPGVKRINKEKAFENLILLKEVLYSNDVHFQLTYGTLLGAVRDHDFITHDEDIDLLLLDSERTKFINCLPTLIEKGFRVARYDKRGLLSIIRNGEYVDFYFFVDYDKDLYSCCGNLLFKEFLDYKTSIKFKGSDFDIPLCYIEFLEYQYGKNWSTPVQWMNFEQSKLTILLQTIKIYVKDSMPMWLFNLIAKHVEKNLEKTYLPRITEWTQNGKLEMLRKKVSADKNEDKQ